jgi:hypothetical protein
LNLCGRIVDDGARFANLRVGVAEIVCGIGSTLLLESLAQKNKMAVFSIRHKCIDGFHSVFRPAE